MKVRFLNTVMDLRRTQTYFINPGAEKTSNVNRYRLKGLFNCSIVVVWKFLNLGIGANEI